MIWTEATDWMGKVVFVGPGFRYRWALGDFTDQSDTQDIEMPRS